MKKYQYYFSLLIILLSINSCRLSILRPFEYQKIKQTALDYGIAQYPILVVVDTVSLRKNRRQIPGIYLFDKNGYKLDYSNKNGCLGQLDLFLKNYATPQINTKLTNESDYNKFQKRFIIYPENKFTEINNFDIIIFVGWSKTEGARAVKRKVKWINEMIKSRIDLKFNLIYYCTDELKGEGDKYSFEKYCPK
jgi:hypothetical protein